MRRLALLSAVVLALLQPTGVAGAGPGGGVIRGQVLNGATGSPQPGVTMVLTQSKRDGPTSRTFKARSDSEGRYRFEGLSTGNDVLYALDARYDGGLFAGRVLTLPEQENPTPVIDTKIKVWPTSSDPRTVVVARDDLFVRPSGGDLSVIESVTVANLTRFAYIGRANSSSGPRASLGFALPASSECRPQECGIVASDPIDIPTILRRSYGFAATVAIPPGRTQITYSYRAGGSGGSFDLSRTALYPTAQFSVYATEPLELESDRLRPDGERTIGGETYRVWSSRQGIDAGNQIGAVAVAQAGASATLIAGVAVALVVAVGAISYALWRRRRAAPIPAGSKPASRDQLLRRIAELDLEFEAGALEAERYAAERSRLKELLAEQTEPVA
jgi:hypothetical protein